MRLQTTFFLKPFKHNCFINVGMNIFFTQQINKQFISYNKVLSVSIFFRPCDLNRYKFKYKHIYFFRCNCCVHMKRKREILSICLKFSLSRWLKFCFWRHFTTYKLYLFFFFLNKNVCIIFFLTKDTQNMSTKKKTYKNTFNYVFMYIYVYIDIHN